MQTITVLYRGIPQQIDLLGTREGGLWLSSQQVSQLTQWEIREEGICFDNRCFPVPAKLISHIDSVEVMEFAKVAQTFGRNVLSDQKHGVWIIGEESTSLQQNLSSGSAPDFSLPDLKGNLHSLSNYQGKKVLLLFWASW